MRQYLSISGEEVPWDLIRSRYRAPSRMAIIMLQDFLSLGSEARFNSPGSTMGNWRWRATADQLEQFYKNSHHYLRELSDLYGR